MTAVWAYEALGLPGIVAMQCSGVNPTAFKKYLCRRHKNISPLVNDEALLRRKRQIPGLILLQLIHLSFYGKKTSATALFFFKAMKEMRTHSRKCCTIVGTGTICGKKPFQKEYWNATYTASWHRRNYTLYTENSELKRCGINKKMEEWFQTLEIKELFTHVFFLMPKK